MKFQVVLPLTVVLLVMVYEASGLSCFCDPQKKCPELNCHPVDHVWEAPCGCCKTCGADIGRNCSSFETPCKNHLWCIKKELNKIEARKQIVWHEPFKGTCGLVLTNQ